MKDRWKILITSLIIGALLATVLFFLSFSFKKIQLREHGLLEYTFYSTVDPTQTVRSNGNYLIGLDYRFIIYPKGILKHEFTVSALTKDKSLVTIEGLFLGELIQS